MYTYFSRASHSCRPNAEHVIKSKNGDAEVRARKDIEEGEEITICYIHEIDLCLPRAERLEQIKEARGFTCNCKRCECSFDDVRRVTTWFIMLNLWGMLRSNVRIVKKVCILSITRVKKFRHVFIVIMNFLPKMLKRNFTWKKASSIW